MKYAILEHGGKQYLAEEGGRIELDRLALEAGKPIEFKEVLLVTDGKQTEVGSPYVSGAKVEGTILEHAKGKKITVFKFKPKQRYRRKQGHRQPLTRVSIEAVALPGSKSEAKAKPEAEGSKSSSAKRSSKRSSKSAAKKAAEGKRKTSSSKQSAGSKKQSASSAGKQTKSKSKSGSGGTKTRKAKDDKQE